MAKTALVWTAVSLLLGACGGTRAPETSEPLSPSPPAVGSPGYAAATKKSSGEPSPLAEAAPAAPAGGQSGASWGADTEASEPRKSSAGRDARAVEPQRRRAEPEARWGLATTWGESLQRPVHTVQFERHSSSPDAFAAVYYNDARGVSAMTRHSGVSAWDRDGVALAGGRVRVRLLDGDGAPLPMREAARRSYAVGHEGSRYAIEVTNHTSERLEVVATVDGLDVIDGQPGAFSKRGYLMSGWATLTIDGFRRSSDAVAAFRFGKVADSYAQSKGDARNVGVVGVAVFRERGWQDGWDAEVQRRFEAEPFPNRYAEPPPPRAVR